MSTCWMKCAASTHFFVKHWKRDILSGCLPLIMAQFQNLVVLCVSGSLKILSSILKLYKKTQSPTQRVCSKFYHYTTDLLTPHECGYLCSELTCSLDSGFFPVTANKDSLWDLFLVLFAQGDLAKKKIYPTLWWVMNIYLNTNCRQSPFAHFVSSSLG